MHHFGEARKGPRGFVQPILTGHHGASQYGRPAMRNKTEAIDGRSIIHHDDWTKIELERYRSRHITPSQLHLCNRETFLFHFDHQRYEAHFKESFQVQETISAYHTWAWASNFDIYDHWPHWSHAIHSCLWLRVHKRTSGRWRQCECSASPFASLNTNLLLSSRPPIIWESLPRFPPQRSVIFFL